MTKATNFPGCKRGAELYTKEKAPTETFCLATAQGQATLGLHANGLMRFGPRQRRFSWDPSGKDLPSFLPGLGALFVCVWLSFWSPSARGRHPFFSPFP